MTPFGNAGQPMFSKNSIFFFANFFFMFLDRFDVLICPRRKTAPATAVVLKTDWVIKQRGQLAGNWSTRLFN
jgi:hypothetical protein